jgi:hypothetical protein
VVEGGGLEKRQTRGSDWEQKAYIGERRHQMARISIKSRRLGTDWGTGS